MTPTIAHGVSGRSDLPLELWQLAFAAGVAVATSSAVLGLTWRTPRLGRLAAGREGPVIWRWVSTAARLAGVAMLMLVVSVALFGERSSRDNLAPVWIYVVFWVGVPALCALFGDVWRHLSPWRTLGSIVGSPAAVDREPRPTCWAAAVLVGFAWLELAYHEPDDVRLLGVVAIGYTAVMLSGARFRGVSWLDDNEGFGALFRLIGALSPITSVDGRLRIRWPLSGLSRVEPTRGALAVALVALGSTTFDGLSRTELWSDVVGDRAEWSGTAVRTIGLALSIVTVAGVYVTATRLGQRLGRSRVGFVRAQAALLVPIALAYALAHYFSALVFDGQTAWFYLSDPYGAGWDLFGQAGERIDYRVISATVVAWIQLALIVIGHIGAAVLAHDRTLELVELHRAQPAQYPLLTGMIGSTVVGLVLLLNS